MKVSKARKLFALMAILAGWLWVGSLFLPAIATCYEGNTHWRTGLDMLGLGWWGILFSKLGWYANIIIFIAFIKAMLGKPPGIFFSLLACILALTSLSPFDVWPNEAWSEPVCMRGIGFWVWIAAFFVVLVMSFIFKKDEPYEQ